MKKRKYRWLSSLMSAVHPITPTKSCADPGPQWQTTLQRVPPATTKPVDPAAPRRPKALPPRHHRYRLGIRI
ncbi:hypothetical protein Vi05172_g6236 [Venturia inaequalis]|nr:hypothetical protein Vi05172_g6236 [Venturia inaequalis]